MTYFGIDYSKYSTVTTAPPRQGRQEPHPRRRTFIEIISDMRVLEQDIYEQVEEARTQKDVRAMRAALDDAIKPLNAFKLAMTDLALTLDMSQRTAPPTIQLVVEQREPGRMSLPNLPPMLSPMPQTIRPHADPHSERRDR